MTHYYFGVTAAVKEAPERVLHTSSKWNMWGNVITYLVRRNGRVSMINFPISDADVREHAT